MLPKKSLAYRPYDCCAPCPTNCCGQIPHDRALLHQHRCRFPYRLIVLVNPPTVSSVVRAVIFGGDLPVVLVGGTPHKSSVRDRSMSPIKPPTLTRKFCCFSADNTVGPRNQQIAASDGDQSLHGSTFRTFHVWMTAPPFAVALESLRVPLSFTLVTVYGPFWRGEPCFRLGS